MTPIEMFPQKRCVSVEIISTAIVHLSDIPADMTAEDLRELALDSFNEGIYEDYGSLPERVSERIRFTFANQKGVEISLAVESPGDDFVTPEQYIQHARERLVYVVGAAQAREYRITHIGRREE